MYVWMARAADDIGQPGTESLCGTDASAHSGRTEGPPRMLARWSMRVPGTSAKLFWRLIGQSR